MAIQGLRDTSNFVTDQRPKNWRETIMLLYPNGKAPLTALTTVMKTKATDDPEFNWWTKSLPTQRMALSASISASATTIPVTSGALQLKKGHQVRLENTGEVVLVSADPSSDTAFAAIRSFGTTAATAITYDSSGANPNLHVIGSAYKEGSDAPTGINYDPTKVYNYTQIMRNTLEMTRTASKTRLRTGDAVKEAKRECLELHSIEMEKAFILGERKETTLDGSPIRATGGIVSFIDSGNIVANAGTALTMAALEGYLERMFRFGSNEKMAFMGNIAMLAINQAVRKNSNYQIFASEKEFGMVVSRLTCPFGTLVMKTHPLFNQLTGGTNTTAYYGMSNWMLVVDQTELVYRPLDDTKYEPTLQNNGLDGMKSGYLTEAGLEIHHPTSHFLITGLVTGAADS